MAQYGTAWIDVRGNTAPLAADINSAVSKGANFLASGTKTVLGDLGRSTAQLSAGFAAVGTAAAASLIKIGAGYNSLEQSSLAAFQTLLGTADAAKTMQADLREFAKSSPFPRQAFIEGAQKMLAFGIEAKKVIPYLDGIQNAVAAAGGSAGDLNGIVDVIAKIRSSAAFTLQDLNQLGNHGINAAKLIGSQMGMTETEFRDSIFGSPLRGADAIKTLDALIAGMSTTYEGAAAGLKNTWVGAVDRIKGAWRDLGSGVMDPFVTKTGGGSAVDSANGIADALRAVEKNILPVLVPLSDLLGRNMLKAATGASEFVKRITPTQAATKLNQVITIVEKARISLHGLEGVAGGAGIAIAGIAARSVLGPLGFLVPAISPITGVIGGLVVGSKEGRDALKRMADEARRFASGPARDLVEGFGRLAEEISGPFSRVVESVVSGLFDAGRRVIPVAVDALDDLGPPLGRLLDAGGELVSKVLPPMASLLSGAIGVALPVVSTALNVAADAAELLADQAWLVVPALTAIAAVKIAGGVSSLASGFSAASESAKYLVTSLQGIAATQGVSTMAAGMGAAKASVGGLTSSLAAGLNPAVLGVTAAIVAGGGAYLAWKKNNDAVNDAAKELSRTLIEQGADVLPTLGRAFADNLERNKGAEDAWRKTGLSISAVTKIIADAPGDMDEFRQFFNDLGESPRRLAGVLDDPRFSEQVDKINPKIRSLAESLLAMYEAGTISDHEFRMIVNNMTDLDKGASQTAESVGILASRLKAAIGDTKISSDAQKDLNLALSDNAGLEDRRDALARLTAMFPQVAADAGIAIDSQGQLRDRIEAAALSAEDASAMLKSYGTEAKNAGDKSADAGADIELTQENVDGLAKSMEEAKQKASDLATKLLELSGGARTAAEAQRNERAAVDDLTSGIADRIKAVADARQSLADAEADLAEARKGQDGKVDAKAVEAAQRRLADAQERVNKATVEASTTFDINTEAGRRNWDQTQKLIEAYESSAEALALVDPSGQKSKAKLEELNGVLSDLRAKGIIPTDAALRDLYETFNLSPEGTKLKVQADVAGALKDIGEVTTVLSELPGGDISGPVITQIQALVDQGKYSEAATMLVNLPGVYEAEIATVVAQADQAGLDTTKSKIDSVAFDRSLLIRTDLDTALAEKKLAEFKERIELAWIDFMGGGKVSFGELLGLEGRRAAGGSVWPGRWLVGENGPEIIDVMGRGNVYNANQTERLFDNKSVAGTEFMGVDDSRAMRGEISALTDAIAALATRPQAAPVVDVHASAGVEVSAETKLRRAVR